MGGLREGGSERVGEGGDQEHTIERERETADREIGERKHRKIRGRKK